MISVPSMMCRSARITSRNDWIITDGQLHVKRVGREKETLGHARFGSHFRGRCPI
jgi:hypothetical protein